MSLKMVFVTVAVLFALGTTPALMAASRVDVAALPSASKDFPTGKERSGDSNWCDKCVRTRSIPSFCTCRDSNICPKCACSINIDCQHRESCATDASKYSIYCPKSATTLVTQSLPA